MLKNKITNSTTKGKEDDLQGRKKSSYHDLESITTRTSHVQSSQIKDRFDAEFGFQSAASIQMLCVGLSEPRSQ